MGAPKTWKAERNSNRANPAVGTHPKRRQSALWEHYGEFESEFLVITTLKCEDPTKDYTAQLEKMREQCLSEDTNAVKIWR